jgi:hypothetical protein
VWIIILHRVCISTSIIALQKDRIRNSLVRKDSIKRKIAPRTKEYGRKDSALYGKKGKLDSVWKESASYEEMTETKRYGPRATKETALVYTGCTKSIQS